MTFYCIADTCDGETRVMQTHGIYRRRKCRSCNRLFLTEEGEASPGTKNPFTIAQAERKQEKRK